MNTWQVLNKEAEVKEGTTKSGFGFVITDEALDDMELIEKIAELDKNDLTVLPDVLEGLLGKEQKKELYEHCRMDGRVRVSRVIEELEEIFENSDETVKNV